MRNWESPIPELNIRCAFRILLIRLVCKKCALSYSKLPNGVNNYLDSLCESGKICIALHISQCKRCYFAWLGRAYNRNDSSMVLATFQGTLGAIVRLQHGRLWGTLLHPEPAAGANAGSASDNSPRQGPNEAREGEDTENDEDTQGDSGSFAKSL